MVGLSILAENARMMRLDTIVGGIKWNATGKCSLKSVAVGRKKISTNHTIKELVVGRNIYHRLCDF